MGTMASISTRPNGNREIQFVRGRDRKRITIRFGPISMPLAIALRERIEHLDALDTMRMPWDSETTKWAKSLGDSMAKKLAKAGLMPHRKKMPVRVPKTKEFFGSVYFARAGEHVKIGFTMATNARLAALQTGSPIKLELLYSFPGTDAREKQLHHQFRKHRLRDQNEWFHLAPEIIEFIEEHREQSSEWPKFWTERAMKESGGASAALLY
ncbi:MAG: GIY-YIG nuclease family protein [Hyphomicrobiaceae bacterium]|nr:MAG: GIY-YIG nuclease family protein [Hyphomicrobiaceae bacterium]